jgi:hypothetical protein
MSSRSCHAKMSVRPASRLHCATKRILLYWVIVTVRQQSVHSFSALHSMQGAGKGNLRSNDASTYGRCARRIRGSASSVKCCRTVTVTLYSKFRFVDQCRQGAGLHDDLA